MDVLGRLWNAFFTDGRPTSSDAPQAHDDDAPPSSSAPLSGLTAIPIVKSLRADIYSRLKLLSMPEVVDVIRYVDETLAARNAGPSPLLMMRILDFLDQKYAMSATRAGVVIPVLRAQFGDVPRAAFDRALLELERKGRISLKEGNPRGAFIEPLEGIDDPERGFLYFVQRRK